MKIIIESLLSLFTGFITGGVFYFLRLPIPAPSVLPGVAGILGLTMAYLIFGKLFGR